MSRTALSEVRVKAPMPRTSAYDIRDTTLKGFGVRVLPSGTKRFFIHMQHHGQHVWKIVGNANALTVEEARSRAASILTSIRHGGWACFCGRHAIRACCRGRVSTLRTGLETANACRQPELPSSPDSARICSTADCRHHPTGSTTLVRLAADNPGRRRPIFAGPFRHFERGGVPRLPPRGVQPLPGNPALPPQGARALPLGRRDPPRRDDTVGARSPMAAGSRRGPPSHADGLPQG